MESNIVWMMASLMLFAAGSASASVLRFPGPTFSSRATAGRVEVRMAAPVPLEFSRPFRVEKKQKYDKVKLVATPAECAALCQRFDLQGLGALEANVSVSRLSGQDNLRVRASGSLTASDICRENFGGQMVTLNTRAEFQACFAAETEGETGGELDMSDDAAFDEPIVDGVIDLVRYIHPTCRVRPQSLRPPYDRVSRANLSRSTCTCISQSCRCRRPESGLTPAA